MAHASLFCLVICLIYSEAANILTIIPFTSYSHYHALRVIGLELAQRGHNVTVITAYKEDVHPPTYHQVISDNIKIWEATGQPRPNVFTMADMSMAQFHEKILWDGGAATTEISLKSKNVQDFLSKDNSFDLVISELFYQEAYYVLAHKYKAPLVLVTTYGNNMRSNILLRNPTQMATVLNEFVMFRNPTSFMDRVKNFYLSIYELYSWRYSYLIKQDALVEKYIKDISQPMPSLIEMQQNASLVLMNNHFSIDTPTAYLPNFVEVGGMHLKESDNKLPDDLQKILDGAKNGVIYVNFGTNVRSSELPVEKKNAFLNVFRKLKEIVIWKWEESNLENKPDNVIIRKWLPQKEIFAHPNIKVFFSHGGLIGTQEATFNGIPIVGMPIYADQYNNLLNVQNDGHGKIIEYNDLTETTLEKTLNEVLKNNTYKIKAKEIQRRFKDRPMKPLDTAIFWIEYVIRHKGADFMKNPALKLCWLAYNMIDVYVFTLVIILGILATIFKLFLFIKNILKSSDNKFTQIRIHKKGLKKTQ